MYVWLVRREQTELVFSRKIMRGNENGAKSPNFLDDYSNCLILNIIHNLAGLVVFA